MARRGSQRIDVAKNDSVMTVDDLAAYLKLAKSTIYKLAQEGKIPGQKVGRHWRFRRETVDRWLDEAACRRQKEGDRQ